MKIKTNEYKEYQKECIEKALNKKPKKLKKGLISNSFYHYAEIYRKRITDENEIDQIDMTPLFWAELISIIKDGELINININAPPTSGKSITGFAIANEIMPIAFKKQFGLNDIDRDQQEFSNTMRNPEITKTIRVIDEWNELETTGENSSVEEALLNYFSDVMAQRGVHKISCSPTTTSDKNSLIYLEVISTDKKQEVNHCKLYYKVFSRGYEHKQYLGMISIHVGNILNKKWYQNYRKRKFEKMDLILKEGIFRPRVLEYAEVIGDIVKKLSILTKMTSLIDNNIIRNYVKMECRKKKIVQSIIGEELATREVNGILSLYKSYYKISREIVNDNKNKKEAKKKRKIEEIEIIEDKIKTKEAMRKEIREAIKLQENEIEKYKEINKRYNKKEQ